jgi:aldose sugar dehydrogenase
MAAGSGADPVGDPQPIADRTPTANEGKFKFEIVADHLEVPWAMVFLPGGDLLFTERPGRVRLIHEGKLVAAPVYTVPDLKTARGGEIGLMGICLHPEFEKNHFVYLAYGHKDGDVRVARYEFTKAVGAVGLTNPTLIIKGFPAAANHAGCCIKFGPDKKLYITTGESFRKELAQDMTSLGGKTLRLNDDGSTPQDNPFVGKEGVRPEIWSFGHRNSQGMDWQPGTGRMYQSEHGPSVSDAPGGGDEFNLVEKGRNYGWPMIHHRETKDGLEAPLVEWTPAIAPGSGVFYNGDLFPEYKGNFLIGGLRGEGIYRVVLDTSDPKKIVKDDRILHGYGRIRAICAAPDGSIYFSTSNRDGRGRPDAADDRIIRLTAAR